MTTKDFCIAVSTLSLAAVVAAMCGMFAYAILDPAVDDKIGRAHV